MHDSEGNFSDFDSFSVVFDQSMKDEVHETLESFRSKYILENFASKFGHIRVDRQFFTEGLKTNDSTGFGVYKDFHSAAFMFKKPCSVYVAELAAIHYTLEYIFTLPTKH